jgi:hypothetical protein
MLVLFAAPVNALVCKSDNGYLLVDHRSQSRIRTLSLHGRATTELLDAMLSMVEVFHSDHLKE